MTTTNLPLAHRLHCDPRARNMIDDHLIDVPTRLFAGATPISLQDVWDWDRMVSDKDGYGWPDNLPMRGRLPWPRLWAEFSGRMSDFALDEAFTSEQDPLREERINVGMFVWETPYSNAQFPFALHVGMFLHGIQQGIVWVVPEISMRIQKDGTFDMLSNKHVRIEVKGSLATAASPKLAEAALDIFVKTKTLRLFLSMLHVKNCRVVERKVPRVLRRRQKRQGVTPWVNYKTLEMVLSVDGQAKSQGSSVEAREAVSLHAVRGHFVDLRDHPLPCFRGVWWRRAHLRGHAEVGVVAKQYAPKVVST